MGRWAVCGGESDPHRLFLCPGPESCPPTGVRRWCDQVHTTVRILGHPSSSEDGPGHRDSGSRTGLVCHRTHPSSGRTGRRPGHYRGPDGDSGSPSVFIMSQISYTEQDLVPEPAETVVGTPHRPGTAVSRPTDRTSGPSPEPRVRLRVVEDRLSWLHPTPPVTRGEFSCPGLVVEVLSRYNLPPPDSPTTPDPLRRGGSGPCSSPEVREGVS